MKVTIYGIGYVGLVQGAVLADAGYEVLCIDTDESKVENLKAGIIPIYEPGLSQIVEHTYSRGRLNFSIDTEQGVHHGDLQFIAVGTPPDEDGSADLQYVLAVARSIATYMTAPKIIVDKSTVPVGTADEVSSQIKQVLEERGEDI